MKLIIFKIIHLAHTPVSAGDRNQVAWQRIAAAIVAILWAELHGTTSQQWREI